MTVTHTGSTQKFAEGWQKIFGSGKGTKRRAAKPAKSRAAKKSPRRGGG